MICVYLALFITLRSAAGMSGQLHPSGSTGQRQQQWQQQPKPQQPKPQQPKSQQPKPQQQQQQQVIGNKKIETTPIRQVYGGSNLTVASRKGDGDMVLCDVDDDSDTGINSKG